MQKVDFRQSRIKDAFFMVIPYVNIVFIIIWLFTWMKDLGQDMTAHTGMDFNKHYSNFRLGWILLVIGALTIYFIIGIIPYFIGIIMMILALYNMSKDFETHMMQEGTYDGTITKGLSFISFGNAPTYQLLVNYHWRQHGYKPA